MHKINTAQDGAAFAQDFADLLTKYGFTNGYFIATNTTPDKPSGSIFTCRTKTLSDSICGYFNATERAIAEQHPIKLSSEENHN